MLNPKIVELPNRSTLFYCQSSQFKTALFRILVPYGGPWRSIRSMAALHYVMARSTEKYPTTQALNRKKDDLYAVSVSPTHMTFGTFRLTGYTAAMLNSHCVPDGTDVLAGTLDVLDQIMHHPKRDARGLLQEAYVQQTLTDMHISYQGVASQPSSLVRERFWSRILKDNPYHIMGKYLDYAGELLKTDASELTGFMKENVGVRPEIYAYYGSASEEEVTERILSTMPSPDGPDNRDLFPDLRVIRTVPEPEQVTESSEFGQSQLLFGYTFEPELTGDDRAAVLMLDSILGGSPVSKLFTEVRERSGLCYDIGTSLLPSNNLLIVGCGLSAGDIGAAEQGIREQIEKTASGEISEAELVSAKESLCFDLMAHYDSPDRYLDYQLYRFLGDPIPDIPEMIRAISQTTQDDVAAMARRIRPRLYYRLVGKKGGDAE